MADTERLDLRVDEALAARVDELAQRSSRPGAKITRSAAARMALLRGLDLGELLDRVLSLHRVYERATPHELSCALDDLARAVGGFK